MWKNGNIFRFFRRFVTVSAVMLLIAVNYSDRMQTIRGLPETLHLDGDAALPEIFTVPAAGETAAVGATRAERLTDVQGAAYTFRLFGVIPLRTVHVVRGETTCLMAGGHAVGITLHTSGVLVVGLGAVETEHGVQSPAAAGGVQSGDLVLRCNGAEAQNAKQLGKLCAQSNGVCILTVARGGETLELTVYLACDAESGEYRLGAWVRDSTAGVGTLSFYRQDGMQFAALGHAVSDIDTQTTLTVGEGKLLASEIVDVIPGTEGEPGELLGIFSTGERPLGTIRDNTDYGIFGTLSEAPEGGGTAVPLAYAYEAHTGPAVMLSTISGSAVTAFDCEIVRVNPQQTASTKGMIVAVTDERLLETTGGIVQGMSGSPILQDGKLLGVVTHVFVNDPTRGYCVYAEWMEALMQ